MITLSAKLRKNRFDYTLVSRGERACIYEQRVSQNLNYYEVFRVQISPKKEILGKVIPKREKFPSDKDFGETAWTYTNYEDAERRFKKLEKKLKNI